MQGNFREALLKPLLFKRIAIYSVLTLLLGSAQCSFFPLLKICPSTPDLIMGLILAVMLIDSERSAAVLAICAGFFIDAIGGGALALSPIIYLLFVLFAGSFSRKMLTSFASYAILMMPMLSFGSVAGVIFPELLCTALLCLPLYAIVKICASPLETHTKFTF